MSLVANSRIQDLFGIGDESDPGVWDEATVRASECLPLAARPRAQVDAALQVAELVLLEGQYGPRHHRLSRAKRLYYRVRPLMTPAARRVLRRAVVRRGAANGAANWPVDDRYVRHAERALEAACVLQPPVLDEVRPFWPEGKRFALVLTHDVESAEGLARIWDLVELEERVGVRSSFNLVAGEYPVDMALVRELHARGFEVGVHGWRHDGRMFESLSRFDGDCVHINQTLREWGAVGFRSPMTHRHPVPMQELAVEYDSSFFDTDPFEPISGGVMTIWPFFMGRFVELPYTLPQDHTLIETMGETTPRVWLEKSRFIAEHGGMALLNSHPEYLCLAGNLHMYEEFLDAACCEGHAWRALPKDVSVWWRLRSSSSDLSKREGHSG
jgi:peptidoglycan/xylan/chitin deacetylase (PgdA/CDA1 family)